MEKTMRWSAVAVFMGVLCRAHDVSGQDLRANTSDDKVKNATGVTGAITSQKAARDKMEIDPSLLAVGIKATQVGEIKVNQKGLVVDTDDNKPTVIAKPGQAVGKAPRSKAEASLGRPVGLIVFSDGESKERRRCTGWLVSPAAVVTNAHCVKNDAPNSKVSFDYVDGTPYATLKWYTCTVWPKSVLLEADLAVLRCGEKGAAPGDAYGVEQLGSAPVADNDPVMVIHQYCDKATFPQCEPTKMTVISKVSRAAYSSFEFSHLADTAEGSSGAPVFARMGASKGMVVGVHHGGCSQSNNCTAPAAQGRGAFNLAIQLKVLKTYLEVLGIVD
jgi:V8-like Glu-specific endopeptidase